MRPFGILATIVTAAAALAVAAAAGPMLERQAQVRPTDAPWPRLYSALFSAFFSSILAEN